MGPRIAILAPMSRMTIVSHVFAYEEEEATGNPSRKAIDWPRTIGNVPVRNPETLQRSIEPLGTWTVFDGTRPIALDVTTELSLGSVLGQPSKYRLAVTGGTDPVFRVDREVALIGVETTVAVNPNLSVTISVVAGAPFASVEPGDVAFVRGPLTGFTSPFSPLNEGYWTVLTAAGASITVTRNLSEVFSATSEVVTPDSNQAIEVFSPGGVQVGDTVDLLGGFVSTAQRAYEITDVNPGWLEITSTAPLGAETGVQPGPTGFVVHTAAKKVVILEVSQECLVRVNGDTGSAVVLTPWVPGDSRFPAEYRQTGSLWKLQLVNKSTVPLKAVVLTAE